MSPTLLTVIMLTASNIFMTIAGYGHLQDFKNKAWWLAALVSWGIALFEYLIQVPANRIGNQVMNVGQLKILQEVITLLVFGVFSYTVLKEPLRWNDWVGFAFIAAAVFFIFYLRPATIGGE